MQWIHMKKWIHVLQFFIHSFITLFISSLSDLSVSWILNLGSLRYAVRYNIPAIKCLFLWGFFHKSLFICLTNASITIPLSFIESQMPVALYYITIFESPKFNHRDYIDSRIGKPKMKNGLNWKLVELIYKLI